MGQLLLQQKKEKVKKEFIKSPDTIRAIPKRDSKRAERALRIAGYQCEYNKDDRLFIRKNGKCGYTEPHHLIPLSHYDDFKYSLDGDCQVKCVN